MQIDNGKIYRETWDDCYDCYDWGGCPHKGKFAAIEGKLKVIVQECSDYKSKAMDL